MGLLTGKFTADKAVGAKDVRGAALDWMVYFKDGRMAPEFAARLDAVRDLLTSGGRSLTQGALAWLWARSPRTLPIPGFRTVAQVEENAGALEKGPLPFKLFLRTGRTIGKTDGRQQRRRRLVQGKKMRLILSGRRRAGFQRGAQKAGLDARCLFRGQQAARLLHRLEIVGSKTLLLHGGQRRHEEHHNQHRGQKPGDDCHHRPDGTSPHYTTGIFAGG